MADENKGAEATAPKSKEKTVKVNISKRNIIHSRGVSYGPGSDIEVPVAVAERHGLKGAKAERKAARKTARSTKRAKRSGS